MRRLLTITLLLAISFCCDVQVLCAADDSEEQDPPAEVTVVGADAGKLAITSGSEIPISFPTAMIEASEIDVEVTKCPIRFAPEVEGRFIWKSQTDGVFTAGPVPPGTRFGILLSNGLLDLSGKPVKAPATLATASSLDFEVQCEFEKVDQLPRRPSVPLRFSYVVAAADLASKAWLQDRDTRERFAVEVVVGEAAQANIGTATVTPRADLPGGRTIDLVVEGLTDAETRSKFPQLFVKPLGKTGSLAVTKIAAFNYPLKPRRIAVEFNEPVDPAEGARIVIEPKVANVKCRAAGDALWFEGDFVLDQRYQVTVSQAVRGKSGFTLGAGSRWGASFQAKKPAIIFPTEDLHQRSRLGLRFAFVQVNTGPLHWKLARVAPEKLLAVNQRIREFTQEQVSHATGEVIVDADTGWPKWTATEMLVDAARVETVHEADIPASPPEEDTIRELSWKPANGIPAGAYVLEISGRNASGKVIGNRALITFTEFAAVQKKFADTRLLRVMSIADGRSIAGLRVRAVTAKNEFLAEAVTNDDGIVRFPKQALFPKVPRKSGSAEWFLMDTPDGPMLQKVNAERFYASPYPSEDDSPKASRKHRLTVTTDRPLYRPGHEVKFKGFAREVDARESLRIPRAKSIAWIVTGDESEELARGTATLDEYGGFDGEWMVPETVKVGQCELTVTLQDETAYTSIEIQEFRPPPFTVELEDLKLADGQAGVKIHSAYFHGAVNAGAKVHWEATWASSESGESDIVMTDQPRIVADQFRRSQSVEGNGLLGLDGTLEVKVGPPFKDGIPRGWSRVYWTVEVTAADGQTIAETIEHTAYTVPVQLSVNGSQAESRGKGKPGITIEAGATAAPDKHEVSGRSLTGEIYRVRTKTAKEMISTNVYRFRNFTTFEKSGSFSGDTPLKANVEVPDVGEYLLAIRDKLDPKIPAATRRVQVTGPGEAEFPVIDEQSLRITGDKPRTEDGTSEAYQPGETAVLSIQSPFAGVAWVSIEAENLVESFVVQVNGSSGRIEVPIKPEYAPNVWASVHLLRPGNEDALPVERYGAVELHVRRPEQELKVVPVLASRQVLPRGMISGEVVVTSENRPVQNADLTLYAVDEAILDASHWHEPPLKNELYPDRQWWVGTCRGLERLTLGVDRTLLHQKGYIVGDTTFKSVAKAYNKELRTNFPPLAFWQTHLRSNENGKVPFSFPAPDGLTKYRIIALGATKQSQFGTGSDWVEVSKPIQIEPALPRFLRVGDEVELRAIVRQKVADRLPVSVRCTVTNLILSGPDAQTQEVRQGLPSVFRFRCKVADASSASVQFETDSGAGDAVEVTLPVHPPTILRKEMIFGSLDAIERQRPKEWSDGIGTASMTVSTSPWLPKITGLPLVLEYPHGCMEQITSRILGYTLLNDFLSYLPQPAGREAAYRASVEAGIKQLAATVTKDGFLSYWPGEERNAFATIAVYWALKNAGVHDFAVPGPCAESLGNAVTSMAFDEKEVPDDPFSRAFSAMVMAEFADSKGKAKLASVLQDRFLRREAMDDEGRALLAIAMHRLNILPTERVQLLREIDRVGKERAFDPETFASTTRTEAIRALAFATVTPSRTQWNTLANLRKQITEWLDSSQSLSTQENFWLLLAYKALHPPPGDSRVDFRRAEPAPATISRNGASAAWIGIDLRRLQEFALRLDHTSPLSCIVEAQYRTESPVTDRNDRGFRIERAVKNLTDEQRLGTEQAPFRLGDQILISYRLVSPKLHHYVALEDELPAALETVNPKIASVARSYSVPKEKGARELDLSHSELRDRVTCLYFNRVEPGQAGYSVLARATAAGVFRWPATHVTPMYDTRYSGHSASSVCYVSGE